MRTKIVLLGLLLVLGCGSQEPPRDTPGNQNTQKAQDDQNTQEETDSQSETDRIQRELRAVVEAVYDSEVQTVLDYTHPRVIKLAGGEEPLRAMIQEVYSEFESANMEVESVTFHEAPTFLQSKANRFSVVPFTSVVTFGDQRIKAVGYQVGVQRFGATDWKYVDGAYIEKNGTQLLLPDFPADYQFPKYGFARQ
ncbi:hypothetical protein [Thalassoroseus pseudoceratinae]|uniref:hypothetical protein n=1 Tax=Thalassoroseus pseudoceratinae TaxID=2713176 RepID=UPI0014220359|nr:hypothetical protein [Thalassoroseus pseudoceratinae]